MKAFFGKIKAFFAKPVNWARSKLGKPAAFMADGAVGGIILMTLLGTQYLGDFIGSYLSPIIAKPVYLLLTLPVFVVFTELFRLASRLLFGKTKRSRIYFLMTLFTVTVFTVIAGQGKFSLLVLLIPYALTAAADILGRALWSALRKGNRSVTGYVLGAAALLVIVAFALFNHLQVFGDDLIEKYLADENIPVRTDSAGEDFADYIADGSKQVKYYDYGPSEDLDIVTETVDISEFASREGIDSAVMDAYFDTGLDETPVAGRIWYPEGAEKCPVMFIVHGNHDYYVPSYLGYDYLGEYLASNGYVVVSVDENYCNGLGDENDGRAVLLLENMKALYKANSDPSSKLYNLLDENRVAIAGHSRGGEMVATAYYFNGLDAYPDNATIKFNYHFNIRSIIAIAPVVDQYMPAGRPVEIENVSYLLLHGANDQDVSSMMGEKQYHNVRFTDGGNYFKTSIYIMGANHGQFNNRWGRYDMIDGANDFLNVNNFISQEDQQAVAKTFIKTFLDTTVRGYGRYQRLFYDYSYFSEYLPRTVYQQVYEDSGFICVNSFDDDADLTAATMEGAVMKAGGVGTWKECLRIFGKGGEGENHVLELSWGEDGEDEGDNAAEKKPEGSACIAAEVPVLDMSENALSFCIADLREEEELSAVNYTVTLTDADGRKAEAADPTYIYPSLRIQLSKTEVLEGAYTYKHSMQTVLVKPEQFDAESGFDAKNVSEITISFPDMEKGNVAIDRLGIQPLK